MGFQKVAVTLASGRVIHGCLVEDGSLLLLPEGAFIPATEGSIVNMVVEDNS
jgi:hypothetical protein